eukprot:GHVP01036960.1.p4 GENE.GHVP01036960.1~~GHVP01036960.1.p4  ORF type:complete len:105 (+),score=8.84 GHVP01036960.1:251-565(+)
MASMEMTSKAKGVERTSVIGLTTFVCRNKRQEGHERTYSCVSCRRLFHQQTFCNRRTVFDIPTCPANLDPWNHRRRVFLYSLAQKLHSGPHSNFHEKKCTATKW